jgi:hypothetical protein
MVSTQQQSIFQLKAEEEQKQIFIACFFKVNSNHGPASAICKIFLLRYIWRVFRRQKTRLKVNLHSDISTPVSNILCLRFISAIQVTGQSTAARFPNREITAPTLSDYTPS